MTTIPGFILKDAVKHTGILSVFRGIREKEHADVIIKTSASEHPHPLEIARLKHEYEITQALKGQTGIIESYELTPYDHHVALVMEDVEGISLSRLIHTKTIDLTTGLRIAIDIAKCLQAIHFAHVIHKDIQPQNIIIQPDTKAIKIIDFGLSTRLERERISVKAPELMEGTLAYMSPEQTGRMGREITYRSDFYSLGVVLYEMFTGRLPFISTNPLELIHFHIAKDPIPPHEINPKIPLMLSKLILKLMEKNGENRYKSASGLCFDLETCLQQLQLTGMIDTFSLCTEDQYEHLYIPEKLYGREKQIETLYKAFEKTVAGKCQLVLVSGPAGIGKSVLIQEVQRPLTQVAGFFTTGKFEQFKRNIFRTAIIEAFENLVRQILSEPEKIIAVWKTKILQSVGDNGQAIIDVIPDLEAIIGKQNPLPPLPPKETGERFDAAFLAFIRTFISKKHPLILFLDDMQWIDLASLKLLKSLMKDSDGNNLLILGAYRSVPSDHPLALTIEEIDKTTHRVVNIDLPPLEQRHIGELLADTFYLSTHRVREFAKIIKEKTEGNPFFIKELIKTLYVNKHVNFNTQSKQWEWSVDSLRLIEATDNVIALLNQSIGKLSQETGHVLKIAASLGNIFHLKTLSEVISKEQPAVAKLLRIPIEKGMIIPIGDTYEFFSEYDQELSYLYNYEDVDLSFKFAHDRVQQTAYALMSDREKQAVHYEIGRRLVAATRKEAIEDVVFSLVYHLNHALDLVSDPEERLSYAQLNLRASIKAKNASSFNAAVTFATQGLQWLTSEQKKSEYPLWYALCTELAECYYHVGEIDRSHHVYQETLRKAKTLEDEVKITIRCNDLYQMKHEYQLAITKASEALERLGDPLPKKVTPFVLWKELLRLRRFLYRYPPHVIESLPPMTDSRKLLIAGLLTALVPPTKIANRRLFFVVCIRLLLMTAHGISPYTVVGLAVNAVVTAWKLKKYDLSFDLAKLAMKFVDKYGYQVIEHFPLYVFASFVADRKHTLEHCNQMLIEAYKKGLSVGDLIFSGYALYMVCWHGMFAGEPINQLLQKTERAYAFNARYHNAFPTEFSKVLRLYFLALQGKSKGPSTLSNEQFDTQKLWKFYQESGDSYMNVAIGICQANLCFLHEDYQQAINWLEKGKKELVARVNFQVWVHTHYLECLILAALYPNQSPQEQQKSLNTMRKNLQLLKEWAERYPINKRHYYPLAKAEYERLTQPKDNILDTYLDAIRKARADHFLHDEAIANELAGKYQLEKGRKEIAETFLLEALWGYHQWGARVKVHLLKTHYPSMLRLPELAAKGPDTPDIDLIEVVKMSREIPRRLVLDQLIDQFMKNVASATAATKAFLLLVKEGKLFVVGEWNKEAQRVRLLKSLPLEEKRDSLCQKAVSYVEKVKEPLVLPSACQEGLFINDDYVAQNQIQSVFCLPLVHKGVLIGILYLENGAMKDAFPPDRVEMLRLLSPEFALAIDNANVYTHLKQTMGELETYQETLKRKVDERSNELTTKNKELELVVNKLHQAQKQMVQQEKLSALGFFTQGVANEIQTPLNSVNQFSEEIIDQLEETSEKLKKQPATAINAKELMHSLENVFDMSKKINENGARIKKIVDIMLEHGQVRKGRLALVNVNELLKESAEIAYDDFLSNDEAFAVDIEEHFEPTLPKIEAFPQDLFRVFFNIIQNALYFAHHKKETSDTSFSPKISLTTQQGKGFVDIFVRDNGEGISEDIIDDVLTQFFTTKPVGTGTGLGLSLSRDLIVHEHGGKLSIRSSTEKESSFTEIHIKLPTRSPK